MKKILVHGSYFGNNFGDTLLIKLLCDRISSYHKSAQVMLAVRGNHLEQKAIGYPVATKHDLGDADYLIFSGGGYFGEPNTKVLKWSIRNYFRHLHWLSRAKKAKVLFFGVGFGPLNNVILRRLVLNNFQRAHHVLLRDLESIKFLGEYGYCKNNVDQCVDYALSIKPSIVKKEKRMLFHVHKLPVAVIDELLISFDTWLDGKYEFILFYDVSTNYKEQEKKYHELLSKIQHRSIKFELFENFNSCRDFIDGSELIVTSKLHVGIVGIATGCKVISIPTHSKTIRLYKQLGLENFCIPVRNYSIERLTIAFNSLDTFEPDFDAINLGIGKMEVVLKQFLDAK